MNERFNVTNEGEDKGDKDLGLTRLLPREFATEFGGEGSLATLMEVARRQENLPGKTVTQPESQNLK